MNAGTVTMQFDRAKLEGLVQDATSAGLEMAAIAVVARVKDSFTKTTMGQAAPVGSPPSVQNDTLSLGIRHFHARGSNVAYVHTSNAVYARIQEFGGVINAKPGKFLPVPVSQAARRVRANTKGPSLRSSGTPMRIVRTKTGKLMLVRDLGGRSARTEVLFVLKRQVRMPARPYMGPIARDPRTLAAMIRVFKIEAVKVLTKGVSAA
jgi:phage gpG-like protein